MADYRKSILMTLALPIILALTSLGCGLSGILNRDDPLAEEPTPTRTAMPTFTPTPEGAGFVSVAVNDASPQNPQPQEAAVAEAPQQTTPVEPAAEAVQGEEPTPTATLVVPVETPTPVPEESGPPQVTILQDMNVRTGPGTGYPIAGPGPAGETALIIGRNTDSSWVQVEYPLTNDKTGWVYAPLVQIDGDLSGIDVVQVAPPPAPVAVAPAEPTPVPAPAEPPPPPPVKYQFTPTGWHASPNAGIIQFKGRIKDEGGNLVNGYSVLLDNWSWSVISHPTGASHHYPQKGDGEWDVVIANKDLGNGLGWWYLTVVRYECPDFLSRFDAQCKQFTRLSEDVKIQVNWPDETIINADWICHWDCDKGIYTQGYRE
jgi:uncharacterized protein YraI